MRILFLTQIVPFPPDSGPKVKTYHVLRYLAAHGHHVTLATFAREAEHGHLASLGPFCESICSVPLRRSRTEDVLTFSLGLQSTLPFLVRRDAKPEMFALVNRLVHEQSFDIVHADQLTMAQYALASRQSTAPLRSRGPRGIDRRQSRTCEFSSPSLVFDAHNAVWTIAQRSQQNARFFLRPLLAQEARRLKKYEGKVCREMDAVLAVSDVDKRALLEAGADADKISMIPIAVDSSSLARLNPAEKPPNILIVSTLFYPPNADGVRWFIYRVCPLIRGLMPEAMLTIVGHRPPHDIMQFAARNSQFATVTGYVPELQPYLERAAVMVVPVRAGSGMRVRILEALARGVPVVTTTTGVEGIEAVHGQHLLVADEPGAFAEAVVRLIGDPMLGRRLAANGRRLVEERYDWKVVLPKLEQVYSSLVDSVRNQQNVG